MTGPFTGSRAWLLQRLSALYLLGFLLYAIVRVPAGAPWTYDAWRSWLLNPGITAAVLLLFVALLTHAWIGVRDVILDYVHPLAVRTALLGAVAVAEAAIGMWVLAIFIVSQ